MSCDEIKQFTDWYHFIDSRCAEVIKYKHPGCEYDGFDFFKNFIIAHFSDSCYGEVESDYEMVYDEDLFDNTILSEKYADIYNEFLEKQKQAKELAFEKNKEIAKNKIDKLKKEYNL